MALLVCALLFPAALSAQTDTLLKPYEIPQASVQYLISGGGMIAPDVNLTIKGKGKRRFKAYGAVELIQKELSFKVDGVLHERKRKKIVRKRERQNEIVADFDRRKIRERVLSASTIRNDLTKGMEQTGQQMIADVVCTMWESAGVKRCLYKGVPLFTEYRLAGLYYKEEAINVHFDIDTNDTSACAVPDYPMEKVSLYKANFKRNPKKHEYAFHDEMLRLLSTLRERASDPDALSPQKRTQLLNRLGEPIFKEQKKRLPELLKTLKVARACLMQAEKTSEANKCIAPVVAFKRMMSDREDNEITDWKREREGVLEEFDSSIAYLASRMSCIRSAKRLNELASCMRK